MAEYDSSPLPVRAARAITEHFKVSLSIPAGSLTPTTLVALAGIAQGTALQIAPQVTATIAAMQAKAAEYISGNVNLALAASLNSAATSLQTMGSQMLPVGNHAALGSLLGQAQAHIADSNEIQDALTHISSLDFSNLGAGITNMSSMVTRGLDTVMGDLSSVASAMKSAGPLYNLTDMPSFGSAAGLINNLSDNYLGESTGINAALTKAGVALSEIAHPLNTAIVDKVLSSITDKNVIGLVTDQFYPQPNFLHSVGAAAVLDELAATAPPVGAGGIQSLKDFTDINKIVPGGISGLSTDLAGISSKLGNMGASFKVPADAVSMLGKIQIPSIPNLNAFVPSLSGLSATLAPAMASLTGSGSGINGLPIMSDFTEAIAGGPSIDSMFAELASGTTSAISSAVDGINGMISSSSGLMSSAGINLALPVLPSLGSALAFATGLHSFGVDSIGSGVGSILGKLATPGVYGDSIKASLTEGANKLAMLSQGIAPLDFSGIPNPLAGLPSMGTDNTISSHAAGNAGLAALKAAKASAGPSSIFAVAPIPDKIDFSNPQNQTVQQFGRV